jgi:hypothetical protein
LLLEVAGAGVARREETGTMSGRCRTRHYLFSLPGVALAILLGRFITRRLAGPSFLVCVHMGLILIGTMLLLQAAGHLGPSASVEHP